MTAHPDELLARSLDRDLGRAEQAAVNAHLAACARCRALAADLRRVDPLIAKREEVSSVPVFDPHMRRAAIGWLWAPIALAAAIVAVTIVGMPRNDGAARPGVIPSASPTPTPSASEAYPTSSPSASPSSRPECATARTGDLTVCPARVTVGDTVTVEGRSCNNPGANTELYFGTTDQFGQATEGTYGAAHLASVATAADGRFRADVTIPSLLISIQGQGGGAVKSGLYAIYTKPPACTAYITVGRAAATTWHGFYLQTATTPDGTRRSVLMETDGAFPGTLVDDRLTWSSIGRASPDGSRWLAYANDDLYMLAPGARPRLVVSGTRNVWGWIDNATIYAVRDGPGTEPGARTLVQVRVGDGSTVKTQTLARGVGGGVLSPGGRYLAYSIGGGDTPPSTYVYELATNRERVVARAAEFADWIDAEHLVAWNRNTVDVVRASDGDRVSVFSGAEGVFASPDPSKILVLDGSGVLWLVTADGTKSRLPGEPINLASRAAGSSGWPASITTDGRAVSFDVTTARYPEPHLYRAGVRDLATGEITYACESDCTLLRIR